MGAKKILLIIALISAMLMTGCDAEDSESQTTDFNAILNDMESFNYDVVQSDEMSNNESNVKEEVKKEETKKNDELKKIPQRKQSLKNQIQ